MSTIASVSPLVVFGANAQCRDPFQFADDHTLLYIAGGNLVLHNPSSQVQKFVPSTSRESVITAVCVTKERSFVAIGERVSIPENTPLDSSPNDLRSSLLRNSLKTTSLVQFYGLPTYRKRKTIDINDLCPMPDKQPMDITGLSFSSDSHLIAVLASSVLLSYWSWEKPKCLGWTMIAVGAIVNKPCVNLSVSVNPFDDGIIAVYGPGSLSMFAPKEGNLVEVAIELPVAKSEIDSFSWISATRFAVGARGCIVIMENYVFKCFYVLETVENDFKASDAARHRILSGSNHQKGETVNISGLNAVTSQSLLPKKLSVKTSTSRVYPRIDAMCISNRLFIVSCNGILHIYERDQEDASDVIKLLCRSPLVVSSTNDSMINGSSCAPSSYLNSGLYLGNRQVLVRSLVVNGSEELALAVLEDGACYSVSISMNELAKGDALQCCLVLPAFHSGSVTSMDVCFRKPLIATGSTDRTIRIWNFSQFSCELAKTFPEEPLSISIHPSGFYMLAGFSDKLRLFTILPDDFRTLHEFPIRGCRECSFSRGGHQFAAAHSSLISVYNVWTFDLVASLKAHNGRIRSLYWSRGTGSSLNQSLDDSSPGGVDLDDSRLISCGTDGAVYSWVLNGTYNVKNKKQPPTSSNRNSGPINASNKLDESSGPTELYRDKQMSKSWVNESDENRRTKQMDAKRNNEYIHKGVCFNSAVDVAGTIFAVGTDRTLKVVTDSLMVREIKSYQVDLVQIAMSQNGQMFFVGTSLGTVKAIKSPLPPEMIDIDASEFMQEHAAHSMLVTKMRITVDDRYLVTAGEEGCVMVFRIWDHESKKGKNTAVTVAADEAKNRSNNIEVESSSNSSSKFTLPLPKPPSHANDSSMGETGVLPQRTEYEYANEVVITRSDLEEKTAAINEMQTRLEELKIEQDYQLRLKDINLQDKLKELTTGLIKEINTLKSQSILLRSEKDKDDAKNRDQKQLIVAQHAHALHEVENRNTQKLMVEYEGFQRTQEEFRNKQIRWHHENEADERKRNVEVAQLSKRYQDLLQDKSDIIEKLEENIEQQEQEFTEHLRQQTEDIETEIGNQESKYKQQLKAEQQVSYQIKGENGIMKKKFLTLTKEIDDSKVEMTKLRENENRLAKIMTGLEREVESLKSEILKRDTKIHDQERRVYDLKKSTQELEKYKYVLDHKIKDLKQQIEPREQAIGEMINQISDTNTALSTVNANEHAMQSSRHELTEALNQANAESKKMHCRVKALARMFEQCQTDITFAIDYIQEPSLLAKSISNLSIKHRTHSLSMQSTQLTDISNLEVQNQEASLKKKIKRLESQIKAQAHHYRVEHYAKVNENSVLISEVRQLRNQHLPSIRSVNSRGNVAQSSANDKPPIMREAKFAPIPPLKTGS